MLDLLAIIHNEAPLRQEWDACQVGQPRLIGLSSARYFQSYQSQKMAFFFIFTSLVNSIIILSVKLLFE